MINEEQEFLKCIPYGLRLILETFINRNKGDRQKNIKDLKKYIECELTFIQKYKPFSLSKKGRDYFKNSELGELCNNLQLGSLENLTRKQYKEWLEKFLEYIS